MFSRGLFDFILVVFGAAFQSSISENVALNLEKRTRTVTQFGAEDNYHRATHPGPRQVSRQTALSNVGCRWG